MLAHPRTSTISIENVIIIKKNNQEGLSRKVIINIKNGKRDQVLGIWFECYDLVKRSDINQKDLFKL
jgi:hypothetical protein